jgi:hypothetical protein
MGSTPAVEIFNAYRHDLMQLFMYAGNEPEEALNPLRLIRYAIQNKLVSAKGVTEPWFWTRPMMAID